MLSNNVITDYIKWADISVYLSMNDFQKQRYYEWIDQRKKTRLLYIVNETLKWGQPYLVGTSGYDDVANYSYALFGKWLLQASYISNTGSGLVIGTPVIPTSTPGAAGTITVTVGVLGSPIPANTDVYTNPILASRTLVVILDNVVIQTSGTTITYSFDTMTGTITFSDNLNLNQVLTIIFI
jgi:hypothetical protein